MTWLWVGLGGALGAVMRFAVTEWVERGLKWNKTFPLGTWLVNVTGTFLLGFMTPWAVGAYQEWAPFLMIGVLGAYTTFSTFGVEAVTLWQKGSFRRAAGYVLWSVVPALALVCLGMWLGMAVLS